MTWPFLSITTSVSETEVGNISAYRYQLFAPDLGDDIAMGGKIAALLDAIIVGGIPRARLPEQISRLWNYFIRGKTPEGDVTFLDPIFNRRAIVLRVRRGILELISSTRRAHHKADESVAPRMRILPDLVRQLLVCNAPFYADALITFEHGTSFRVAFIKFVRLVPPPQFVLGNPHDGLAQLHAAQRILRRSVHQQSSL